MSIQTGVVASVTTAVTGPRAQPNWFGATGREQLGWWQLPTSGTARGAVVFAPSVGQEYTSGYRTLRWVSEALAELGIASLRFDYPGNGDSMDPPAALMLRRHGPRESSQR